MIREMKYKDRKQCVNMLDKEWDLGKTPSHAKGKVCAWIYLFEILEESEKILVYEKDNKVIGLCGYVNWNSKKKWIRKRWSHLMKRMLINSWWIKNKKEIKKYLKDYDYTPKELENYFEGKISILIVDKNYRGKGIGKKLLQEVFKCAKQDDIKNLQVLSDESCNFKFYELCGCSKVYETIIPNGEPKKCDKQNEIGYIYEKRL